jgi:ketosteroid isomerase-like protein
MTAETNKALIEQFYRAFANGDASAMNACYHDQIIFSDPAFGELKGDEVRNMWMMLTQRNKALIHFGQVEANEYTGSAKWMADYIFSLTGRKVLNHISARFEFKDGKISRHTDDFDLWRWSRQAFGFKGLLLGWTPFMKNKIRAQTRKLLDKFMGKRY